MREGEDQERARNQPSGLGPADLEAGRNAGGSGLAELLARVEKAEGPDRELDADLLRAFGWTRTAGNIANAGSWRHSDGSWLPVSREALAASLDAALALVERELPNAMWQAGHDEDDPSGFKARVLDFPRAVVVGRGSTPALALLAALLKALIALPDPPVGA